MRLALGILMVMVLTACGGDDPPQTAIPTLESTPTRTATPPPTTAPTPTPAPTATPAATSTSTPTPEPPAPPILNSQDGSHCRTGMIMREGDSCTLPISGVNVGSDMFEVRDGRGCYGNICSGNRLQLNAFIATKNRDGSWTIGAVPVSTPRPAATPTPNATPTPRSSTTPLSLEDLFTLEITSCSGKGVHSSGSVSHASVTVAGTVTAKRAISARFLLIEIEASANGESLFSDFIHKRTWNAGDTEEFKIRGFISTSSNRLSCNISWNVTGLLYDTE